MNIAIKDIMVIYLCVDPHGNNADVTLYIAKPTPYS